MIIIVTFVIALVFFYFYNTRKFNYWADKGVKHDKPVILFGNNAKNFLMKQSRSQAMEEMYWKYPKERVVGFYRSSTPELILRDPELIKQVLISKFTYFYSRGFHPYPKVVEPLMRNLYVVEGDLWKMLRQTMTPAFTSTKLKAMFPLIVETAEKLQARTINAVKSATIIDAKDLMSRYSIDVIGCCGFGLDPDSLNNEDSEFNKLSKEIFNIGFKEFAVGVLKSMFPELAQNLKFFGRFEKKGLNLMKQIQDSKGNKPSGRGDFVDLLLEFKQKGPIEIESLEKSLPNGIPEKVTFEFDDVLVAAQTYLFFIAGYKTTSSASSYTLHQLAFNPEIQKKVQKEIDEVLARHNMKLSYYAVKEMTYLEWVFKEGMRFFPSSGRLMRVCTRQFTFDDINLTIDPGVRAIVPIQALHMDPKYWDRPKEFRPERFHPDEFTDIQKAVYLPFGDGPRNCVGYRLGLMQSLAGLAAVLSQFTVEPAPESVRFPEVDPTSDVVQSPKGGKLPLIFKRRT
ncbi:hypothetical protein ABMA28_007276 [Loxostege sticticalis]|uniref:unspecific monooxygenase n=1 Tax=Loxostege sticticalis TaxID=481309 RepID=A0ABD0TQA9_LOXSC